MDIRTIVSLAASGRLRLLGAVARLLAPFYRITFVASAASGGLLARLAAGPVPFATLARDLAPEPRMHEALRAWLELGVRLGELGKGDDGYRLRGLLSRELSDPANDDVAALVEEVAGLHHRLISEAPRRLRAAELLAPDEHDGRMIARSSRILEPFLAGVLDRALNVSGPVHLLDVGCGSGAHLLRAAARNVDLRAVGIEVRAAVAEAARAEIERRGLADRITVETGDVRERGGGDRFDVVTLFNVVYYLPVAERGPLVRRLASWLKPGGRLLLATCCQGGSPGACVLDLWRSGTEGSGPLPTRAEIVARLSEAGLVDLVVEKLIAGEEYFLFSARRPG